MSKSFYLSLCAILCASFSCAGDLSSYTLNANSAEAEKASAAIDENIKKYASEGSSEEGVLTLKFDIKSETDLTDDYGNYRGGSWSNLFDTTRKCSLIRIDDNWLIGSAYCFNFDRFDSKQFSILESGTSYTTREVKDVRLNGERITKIYEGGAEVYNNDKAKAANLPLYLSSDIMLLYVGDSAKLKDKYAKLPKSNLYIPSKPELSVTQLKDLNFYVSRKSAFWGAREKQEREIANYCTDTKCIKVKFGLMHAEAMTGDPLFAVAPNSMEFVVAFNTGDEKTKEGQSRSRYFKELSANSYKAIEKTIAKKDPEGWKRIKTKIADDFTPFVKH